MARRRSQTLTDGELRIMDVVWTLGESSVKTVTEHLNRADRVAYNTVQTMLGILADKGYVSYRKQGRAYLYKPIVERQAAQNRALQHLLSRFFSGSPSALVQNLLEDEAVDPMEIERLRRMIDDTAEE